MDDHCQSDFFIPEGRLYIDHKLFILDQSNISKEHLTLFKMNNIFLIEQKDLQEISMASQSIDNSLCQGIEDDLNKFLYPSEYNEGNFFLIGKHNDKIEALLIYSEYESYYEIHILCSKTPNKHYGSEILAYFESMVQNKLKDNEQKTIFLESSFSALSFYSKMKYKSGRKSRAFQKTIRKKNN